MQKPHYEGLKEELKADEQADFRYQERRHSQWTENYQLFRDKIITNRLIQRQSINVPFIKGIIKTVMANIDEFPDIEFEELDNNKDKEIIVNELWKDFVIADKLEVKDIVDKKQNLLYGITYHKFNIVGGRIVTEIKEPFDILKDRYSDPADLNSGNHLIELGIYRTLSQLRANPNYDKGALGRLAANIGTKAGLVKSEEVTRQIQAKNERMELMGVPDANLPQLGQTWFELKAHFKKIYDLSDGKEHWHLILMADTEIIYAKPLLDLIGLDELPIVSWSDDPERLDQYPDGTADIARTTNKLLNSMISAMAENRILRNFGMNIYNSSLEGFNPQTFEPQPFGWYPVPAGERKLEDVYRKVDIPDLSESIDEMEYVKKLVETAVAANSTVQGATEQKKVTLGEVELALAASKERITSIAKFYNIAMKEKGLLFSKLLNANAGKLDSVKLYKKSHKGNFFSKEVKGSDYQSDAGYTCRVVSSAERQKQNIEEVQKINAAEARFQGNPAFKKIADKKILDFIGASPEESQAVLDFEEQKMNQPVDPTTGMAAGPQMPPDASGAPPQPGIPTSAPILNQPVTQPNASQIA
jgi:hypothetical protein